MTEAKLHRIDTSERKQGFKLATHQLQDEFLPTKPVTHFKWLENKEGGRDGGREGSMIYSLCIISTRVLISVVSLVNIIHFLKDLDVVALYSGGRRLFVVFVKNVCVDTAERAISYPVSQIIHCA